MIVCDVGREATVVRTDGRLILPQWATTTGRFVFGDGSHSTTRLCAGAVDLLCGQQPGMAVLDVGTGTGILARIARARGAAAVVATDIDAVALETARRNASLDASPQPIHFGEEPPDHWGARFDLVVANILAEPLLALSTSLVAALAAGGRLLISGFTPVQAPALRQAFESHGLALERDARQDGWMLMMFRKAGP